MKSVKKCQKAQRDPKSAKNDTKCPKEEKKKKFQMVPRSTKQIPKCVEKCQIVPKGTSNKCKKKVPKKSKKE